MNMDLINEIKGFKDFLKQLRKEKVAKFNNETDLEAKKAIKEEVVNLDTDFVKVRDEVKAVKELDAKLNEETDQVKIRDLEQKIYAAQTKLLKTRNTLMKKYNYSETMELGREPIHDETPVVNPEPVDVKVESTSKPKNSKGVLGKIFAGLGLMCIGAGIALGVNGCVNQAVVQNSEKDDEEKSEDEKFEDLRNVDTELYGMKHAFTDASDDKQVMQRAQEIYDTYINVDSMQPAAKAELSVERIANLIRMCNGEFAQENGEVSYNPTMFDELGNIINTYHNSTSFVQMGTDLEFKPTSVFFEQGSLAHQAAAQSDALIEKVYADIRANDVEAFRCDSVAWGEFVRDFAIYNDSTGKTVSVWSVGNASMYPLLKTVTSVYAPSIMEYSIGVDLASRNGQTGMYGNTFGICIPFCYNAQNQLEYIPLSQMIYDINETPRNDLAKRAGMDEVWNEQNESIMVQCGLTSQSWFNEKYNLEHGNSLRLK